jgi:hypothetical protein
MSIESRSLRRSELLQRLSGSRARHVRVFLDACFSGRAPSGTQLVSGLQPLVVISKLPSIDPRTVLLTAARSNEYAGPLPGSSRPAFSYLALGALRGWADRNRDRRIHAGELLDYVRDTLQATVHGRHQTPTLVGSRDSALVHSARERGPDVATLAKQIARGRSAVRFLVDLPRLPNSSAEARPSPPARLDVDASRLDFRNVDVAERVAYDAAVKFDRSVASPLAKAERWGELARQVPRLASAARRRQSEWIAHERSLRAAEAARVEREKLRDRQAARRAAMRDADWAKLAPLLLLEVVREADKRRWAQAFVDTYGSELDANPHLPELAPYLPSHLLPEELREPEPLPLLEWIFVVRSPVGWLISSCRRAAERECDFLLKSKAEKETCVSQSYTLCAASGGPSDCKGASRWRMECRGR